MSLTLGSNFSHFTQTEFCLTEWKTGTFVSQKLPEPSLKETFSGHLKDVIRWDCLAPDVTKNIRQKIFDDLRCVQAINTYLVTSLHAYL